MLISIVVSFRNEQEVIPELYDRLTKAMANTDCDHEIVFVNDDSTDKSLELLENLARRDRRVKIINMSRRFGVEPCLFAGMAHAQGDAMVTIDADLQDPPELIPTLLERFKEGNEVVYTVRDNRLGEGAVKLGLTRLAYGLIGKFANIHIPIEAGDFRLISRRVAETLLQFDEPNTYLRGLVAWVGFPRASVSYVRQPRSGGTTHFSLFSKAPAAALFYGITGFSAVPIYAVALTGILTCISSAIALLVAALGSAINHGWSDMAIWVSFILLLWGGMISAIGVVGLYVSRIHRTTLGRPRYVVKSTMNLGEKS